MTPQELQLLLEKYRAMGQIGNSPPPVSSPLDFLAAPKPQGPQLPDYLVPGEGFDPATGRMLLSGGPNVGMPRASHPALPPEPPPSAEEALRRSYPPPKPGLLDGLSWGPYGQKYMPGLQAGPGMFGGGLTMKPYGATSLPDSGQPVNQVSGGMGPDTSVNPPAIEGQEGPGGGIFLGPQRPIQPGPQTSSIMDRFRKDPNVLRAIMDFQTNHEPALSAGEIRRGMTGHQRQPVAAGLAYQAQQDQLTPEEEAFGAPLGLDLKGVRRSTATKLLPSLLDYSAKQDAIATRYGKAREMPDRDIAEVADMDQLMAKAQSIKARKGQFNTGFWPTLGRNIVRAPFGDLATDSLFEAFKSDLDEMRTTIRYKLSGKQVSATEGAALAAMLPSEWVDDQAFVSKMQAFEDRLAKDREIYLSTRRAAGQDTSGLENDTVWFQTKEGQKTPVMNNPEFIKAAQDAGWVQVPQ